ncbi:type II/IV secretion system protein [Clostridium gasigenes]|uniref:GspE/PulE family protein n=1 Tax=Clostridium gasigenes TaxID=94869 RepID=UPI001C0CA4FC|nr:type II/IV secretion system protein [Clostridium gasigenes]
MKNNKVEINDIDLNTARKVNKELALEEMFLPIKIEGNNLIVIGVKSNERIIEYLNFIFALEIDFIKIESEVIQNIIDGVFSGESQNLHESFIEKAIKLKASDVHVEPMENEVLIRIRTDGKLSLDRKIKHSEYKVLLSKIKIIANMDITEKRRPQDGKYNLKLNNNSYDLRVSTILTVYGEKLVIRILYGMRFNFSLDKIHLTEYQLKKLMRIISFKNGLVIINGPTGSGKSTTLYSILQTINNEEINITTLEDPVEVIIPGINQISLNRKANIDFATGLRSILRQDPDVIMIGEIRDEETASMAVRAALTGHKVYATIHTKTPREVYLRLDDMGVKPYFLKDSIVGIVSQRLIRTLCEKCKVYKEDICFWGRKIKSYEKDGCIECNNTGYKGRTMVSAVELIEGEYKESISSIFQEINLLSNVEMIESLISLLERGLISINDYRKFILEEGINEKLYKESNS